MSNAMKETMKILKHAEEEIKSHLPHISHEGDDGNGVCPKRSVTNTTIEDIMADENLHMEAHLVSAAQKSLEKHWLIDSRWFSMFIFVTIVLNAAQMGMAVDVSGPEWEVTWKVAEHIFTAIFALEMFLKLAILKGQYFSDGWNRLDCLLVTMSIVDVWIVTPLASTDGPMMSQLSVLRVLRICRVARMVRLLKVFKELFVILVGIFQSLRTILWVVLLLAFVLYVCSILCVEIMGRRGVYPGFDDSDEAVTMTDEVLEFNNFVYFGNIPRSMVTLFGVVITAEFDGFGRPMIEKQPLMTMFFLCFVIFTTFGILNVIIGVIVDNVEQASRETDHDIQYNQKMRKIQTLLKLREIVFKLDLDGDGAISLQEMEEGFNNPEFRALLDTIDLPKGWTAQELMWLLDPDGDHELKFDDFIKSFFRLLFSTEPFQQNCCVQVSLNYMKSDLHQILDILKTAPGYKSSDRLEQKLESISQNQESIQQSQQHVDEALNNICQRLEALELHCGAREPSSGKPDCEATAAIGYCKEVDSESAKWQPMTRIPTNHNQSRVDEADIEIEVSADNQTLDRDRCKDRRLTQETSMVRFDAFFGEEVQSLNFEVEWRMPMPVVGNVLVDGQGDMRGIRAGDLIAMVNGIETEGRWRHELLAHFKARPLTLSIDRANQGANQEVTLL